jgi:patatin-like phospholipase/acyl hydrolase
VLRGIMSRIQHLENLENLSSPPLPCEHFDLIGGTSTGGFVAIANLNVAASLPFTQTYGLNARATSNVNRRIHQVLRLTFRSSLLKSKVGWRWQIQRLHSGKDYQEDHRGPDP